MSKYLEDTCGMRALVLNFTGKDLFSEERHFGQGKVIQKTDKEQNMAFLELKQHQGRDNNPEKISDTRNSKNIIWATNRILNSLVVAINKKKEIGKINFNHIFYFTQYSQTTTTPIRKQGKNANESLYMDFIFYYIPKMWNVFCPYSTSSFEPDHGLNVWQAHRANAYYIFILEFLKIWK